MPLTEKEILELSERARVLRVEMLDLAKERGWRLFGGAFSQADILVSLFKKVMTGEDIILMAKGHGVLSLYPLLREKGCNPEIQQHPNIDTKSGVHCTAGSIGLGLPQAVGRALARKMQKTAGRVFVVMGDGDLQEGITWESLMVASHHKLDNLCVIFDSNEYQGSGKVGEILCHGCVEEKLKAFGAEVITIDGHSYQEIVSACNSSFLGKPVAIVAKTKKGRGIKILEDNPAGSHSKFLTPEQYKEAYKDLGAEK